LTSPFYASLCTIIDKTLIRRVNDNLMTPLMNICRAVSGHDELAEDSPHLPLLVVMDGHIDAMVSHFFTLASSPSTVDKQRAVLYRYHGELKQCQAAPSKRRKPTAPTTIPAAPVNEAKAEKKRAKKAAEAAAAAEAADTVAVDETEDNDDNDDDDSDDESSIAAPVPTPVESVKLGKRKQAATPMETQNGTPSKTNNGSAHVPLDAFLLKKLKQTFPASGASTTTPLPPVVTESKIPLFAKNNKKSKTAPAVSAPVVVSSVAVTATTSTTR
jgi:hypothetical protein